MFWEQSSTKGFPEKSSGEFDFSDIYKRQPILFMNTLTQNIIKPFLLEQTEIKTVIGIYAGRFQPFGLHHLKTYQWLKSQFKHAYIATSDKTGSSKHPLNFKQKKAHMTKMGVPANKIIKEKVPYVAKNILKKFDSATTAVVYIFGEKDAGRLMSGNYFRDYKNEKDNLQGYEDQGYILVAPHTSIKVGGQELSGTTMRKLLGSNADDKTKKKLFKKLFGYYNDSLYKMFTDTFVTETIARGYPNKKELDKYMRKVKKQRKNTDSNKKYHFDPVNEAKDIDEVAGVILYIMKDGQPRYLLLRDDTHWSFPKGHLQQGESLLDGATRETYEETGIAPGAVDPKFFHELLINFGTDKQKTISLFLSLAHTTKITLSDEHQEYKWATPEEVEALMEQPEVANLLNRLDQHFIKHEDITVPIEIGDIVLGGRFKNKRITVKTIGKNEKGDITINGRPLLKYRLITQEDIEQFACSFDMKKFIGESSTIGSMSSGVVDDGPRYWYGNQRSYRKAGEAEAAKLGFRVVNYLVPDMEFEEHDTKYPNGPTGAVTYFPAGKVGTTAGTGILKDMRGSEAWRKWAENISRSITQLGWKFSDWLGAKDSIKQTKDEPIDEFDPRNEVPPNTEPKGEKDQHGEMEEPPDDPDAPNEPHKKDLSERALSVEWWKKILERDPNEVPLSKRQPGDVWNTDTGKGAKNKKGIPQYYRSADDAEEYAQGSGYQGIEKDSWSDEHYSDETKEFFNNDVAKAQMPGLFKDEEHAIQKMKGAENRQLDPDELSNIRNSEAGEISQLPPEERKQAAHDWINYQNFEDANRWEWVGEGEPPSVENDEWDKFQAGMESGDVKRKEGWRDISRAIDGYEQGAEIPQSVVVKDRNGDIQLLGGNTRLTAAVAAGKNPSVKIIDYDREFQSQDENGTQTEATFSTNWWKQLITEGGAYGHMAHPFDDWDLTFKDFKNIIEMGLSGNLNREDNVTEKLDGQNLMVSWKGGNLIIARNKGHIKNAGKTALSVKGIASMFSGRGEISNAFSFAAKDLQKAIGALSNKQRDKIFMNGRAWMNLEVLWPASSNVIDYDVAQIVFHGALQYNDAGTVVGQVKGSARMLEGMIRQVNQHIQKHYKIAKPQFLTVPKNQDFTKRKTYYFNKLKKLQDTYGLKDGDSIALWHQMFWQEWIMNGASQTDYTNISNDVLVKLMKRWAFGDKSYKIPDMKKELREDHPEFLDWVLSTDKVDVQKMQKQNMKPFEVLFFELGAEILRSVSNFLAVNPSKSAQKMKVATKKAAGALKRGKDPKDLKLLKTQLEKLQAIGGFDAVVPSEGLVFKYKGNTYKFTGAFAPVNQITGALKFGR
jgi:8-oxo-dGTP pyrophosphatase MutT (NUDIX family)|tara:strand:+ start:23680 stop:27699 length:4020 start_codon:yes stop_codon:yes gene_type:complete